VAQFLFAYRGQMPSKNFICFHGMEIHTTTNLYSCCGTFGQNAMSLVLCIASHVIEEQINDATSKFCNMMDDQYFTNTGDFPHNRFILYIANSATFMNFSGTIGPHQNNLS